MTKSSELYTATSRKVVGKSARKRRATKEFLTATVPGTVYWSYQILPFGIVACTFLPTAFLEIAAYAVLSECLFWHSKRTGLVKNSTRLIVSAALLRNDIAERNNKPVSGHKKGCLLFYDWLRSRNSWRCLRPPPNPLCPPLLGIIICHQV